MKVAWSRKNLWEKLPNSGKYIAAMFLRAIPLRFLLGKRFRETSRLILSADKWTREEVDAFQLDNINRVLQLATKRSSFYRNYYASMGIDVGYMSSLSDIKKLPTISRQVVIENTDEMLVVKKDRVDIDYVTTGGTGGVPMRFYIDSGRSSIEYAYLNAGWNRIGFKLGDTKAVLRGRVVSSGSSTSSHRLHDPLLREHYYSSFHLSDTNVEDYLIHIGTLGPCFLHIYPSTAYLLARHVRKSGAKAPANILGILAESEIVYEEQREFVKSVFGCPYFSSYGHSEKLVAAAECERTGHYHFWPTYGLVELLDEDGNEITERGKVGEIVATGFMNVAMPFIRYRTGDRAEYVGEHCEACGRVGKVVSNIRGHNIQELLVAKDRSLIPWSAVNMHDDTFDNVMQFQFFQDRPGFATIRVVVRDHFDSYDVSKIEQNFTRKFGDRLSAKVEVVPRIELTDRGKSVFVDQKIEFD